MRQAFGNKNEEKKTGVGTWRPYLAGNGRGKRRGAQLKLLTDRLTFERVSELGKNLGKWALNSRA